MRTPSNLTPDIAILCKICLVTLSLEKENNSLGKGLNFAYKNVYSTNPVYIGELHVVGLKWLGCLSQGLSYGVCFREVSVKRD